MDTLSTEQAARLLHMHPKQLQRLARDGRVPAARVGRRWLFSRARIERLLASRGAAASEPVRMLSARNHLRGVVSRVAVDGLMAEVRMTIGDQELVSIITRSSAESLGLKEGDEVLAVIKSTEIMVGKKVGA